jgi:hypothetical protein
MRLSLVCSDKQPDELRFHEFTDVCISIVLTDAGLRIGC